MYQTSKPGDPYSVVSRLMARAEQDDIDYQAMHGRTLTDMPKATAAISETADTAEQLPPPGPGRMLARRYLLGGKIGSGGFGAVYEAEDTRLHKRVAIKIPAGHYSDHPELMERFQREAIAAGQIGHEGIVDVTDFGEDPDGTRFIVMELLSGVSLADLLEAEHRLPVDRALRIAHGIAEALAAAHAAGVIHRDLKPANVQLVPRPFGEATKVLDFGVSKLVAGYPGGGELTVPGKVLGSPYYMSPEQATGRTLDGRADVYALGIILYEMLTGAPPFDGSQTYEILRKHVQDTARAPSHQAATRVDIPPELDALVLRALAKDPAERPTMAELADALASAHDAARAAARPDLRAVRPLRDAEAARDTRRLRTDIRRRRPVALALATLLALISLAFATYRIAPSLGYHLGQVDTAASRTHEPEPAPTPPPALAPDAATAIYSVPLPPDA